MVLRVWPAETSRPSGGEPSMGDTHGWFLSCTRHSLCPPGEPGVNDSGKFQAVVVSFVYCPPFPGTSSPPFNRNTQHLALGLRLE